VRGVVGAVGSGGAVAGAKAVLGHAAGYAKFEVVKHGLVALGVPPGIADAAAIVVAGRGGKAPEVEAEAADPDLARIATKANRPNGAISPTPLRERFPNGLPVEHPGVLPPRVEPTASPASHQSHPLPLRQRLSLRLQRPERLQFLQLLHHPLNQGPRHRHHRFRVRRRQRCLISGR
jgi:hypothetical protein